eukprot:scaffold79141_cov23-Cyclotella_meneghiniana.AAC.1
MEIGHRENDDTGQRTKEHYVHSVSMPSSLDEKAAVREMLRQKRNEGGQDGGSIESSKNVRIRSLDERIAMKKRKPWGMTTMMSISEKNEAKRTIQTDQSSKAMAAELTSEDKLQHKLAQDKTMQVEKSTVASEEAATQLSYKDKTRCKPMDDKASLPVRVDEVVTTDDAVARTAFEERLQASTATQLSYEGGKLMGDKARVPEEDEIGTHNLKTAAQIAFEERYKRHLERKASKRTTRERRATIGTKLAMSLTIDEEFMGLNLEESEDEEPAPQEKLRRHSATVGSLSQLTMPSKDRNGQLESLIGHEGDLDKEKETLLDNNNGENHGASSRLTMSINDRNRRGEMLIGQFEEDEKQQAMPKKGRTTHASQSHNLTNASKNT